MAAKKSKGGLGRGLEALINPSPDVVEQVEVADTAEDKPESAPITHDKQSVGQRYTQRSTIRSGTRPADLFFGGGPDESTSGKTNQKHKRATMPNPLADLAQHKTSAGDATETTDRYVEIPLEQIQANPRQPRTVFDEDEMRELVASISEVGVLQPVVVREVSRETYELVMGERRFRASQRAGKKTIPAVIRETADRDLLMEALVENIHRSDLNPLEEGAAYQQLMDDFDWTQEELSKRIGKSRPQISNTLRLLKLPISIQGRVASGVLSGGHARALLALDDQNAMNEIADRIVREGLSVRATEELVSLYKPGQVKLRRRPGSGVRDHRFESIENHLTDRLDTTVKISLGAKKGKISIEFASQEDLQRIVDLIQHNDSK